MKEESTVLQMKSGIVTYVNPFAYLKLRKIDVLRHFDHITSDGIVIKLLLQIFAGTKVDRISPDFSSYFTPLFAQAERDKSSIYIIGTSSQALEQSIANIRARYPELNVVGQRNGYFNSQEEITHHVEEVAQQNPDMVIVGMGTPLQEQYLVKLKEIGWQGAGYCCGGFLHQTADGVDYYPKWVNKMNLRWLYRIYKEPKLFKRYTIDYGYFVILFLRDAIRS